MGSTTGDGGSVSESSCTSSSSTSSSNSSFTDSSFCSFWTSAGSVKISGTSSPGASLGGVVGAGKSNWSGGTIRLRPE